MQNHQNFNNFIGIDVSKSKLDISTTDGRFYTIANNKTDITAILKTLCKTEDTLVIIDLTGGYEALVVDMFINKGFNVHRAEGRRVKAFARSFGKIAKTDAIDAKLLVEYGKKMQEKLRIYKKQDNRLSLLAERLSDLKAMLQEERNRIQAPNLHKLVADSIKRVIKHLELQVNGMESEMMSIIAEDNKLRSKYEILTSEIGVGEKTAMVLIGILPELGEVNRREIAALSGVAPYAYDSGSYAGRRLVRGGRKQVKSALFMCALSAKRYNPKMKVFADRLSSKGKAKRVVITAVMRKIIITLNAKCKFI